MNADLMTDLNCQPLVHVIMVFLGAMIVIMCTVDRGTERRTSRDLAIDTNERGNLILSDAQMSQSCERWDERNLIALSEGRQIGSGNYANQKQIEVGEIPPLCS